MYEALITRVVQERLTPNPADKTKKGLEILRDMSLSQESCTTAHTAMEDDADLETLITNLGGTQ